MCREVDTGRTGGGRALTFILISYIDHLSDQRLKVADIMLLSLVKKKKNSKVASCNFTVLMVVTDAPLRTKLIVIYIFLNLSFPYQQTSNYLLMN